MKDVEKMFDEAYRLVASVAGENGIWEIERPVMLNPNIHGCAGRCFSQVLPENKRRCRIEIDAKILTDATTDEAVMLKEFARQCRLPLIVTVPLSRDVELRADRRPALSDARHHRRCIDEADRVVLLYRDSCCHDGGDPALQYLIAKDASGSAEPCGWQALDNRLIEVR